MLLGCKSSVSLDYYTAGVHRANGIITKLCGTRITIIIIIIIIIMTHTNK